MAGTSADRPSYESSFSGCLSHCSRNFLNCYVSFFFFFFLQTRSFTSVLCLKTHTLARASARFEEEFLKKRIEEEKELQHGHWGSRVTARPRESPMWEKPGQATKQGLSFSLSGLFICFTTAGAKSLPPCKTHTSLVTSMEKHPDPVLASTKSKSHMTRFPRSLRIMFLLEVTVTRQEEGSPPPRSKEQVKPCGSLALRRRFEDVKVGHTQALLKITNLTKAGSAGFPMLLCYSSPNPLSVQSGLYCPYIWKDN